MKVKHDEARTSKTYSCTSCLFRSESQRASVRKLHQTGPKIDKNYYGKFISFRERILLGKLFGAVYDDITQILPVSNAREDIFAERNLCEILSFNEENIKAAKSSLIGHALKIIETDKAVQSKKLSECCSCCTYSYIPLREHDRKLHTHDVYASSQASGSKAKAETRLGKQQAQQLCIDLCTSQFIDWKEMASRTEMKKMLDKKDMITFCHPTFYKNDITVRETRLADEIKNESLPKLKVPPPIIHTHKIETGFKTPLENFENGMNETIRQSFTKLKQYSHVIHRPPFNFMVTPRISLHNINKSDQKIKKRIDKDATGDTAQTVIKNISGPCDRFSLKRCLCTVTLKPQNNKSNFLIAANAMRNLASKSNLQFKSISRRSKIINKSKKLKKNNRKIIAIVRQRYLNNCNINENSKLTKQEVNPNSHFNFAVELKKEKPVNNKLIVRTWEKSNATEKCKNNRNFNIVENLSPTCERFINSLSNHSLRRCFCTLKLDKSHTKICCKSRESSISAFYTSPIAKFQSSSIKKESKIDNRVLSPSECNLLSNCISHRSIKCKPEIVGIDINGKNIQNIISKKTSPYECKPGYVHDEYNPCICFELEEKKRQMISHNFNIVTDHSKTKPSVIIKKKPTRHNMTETVESRKQINNDVNQRPVTPKRNQAVQLNSISSVDMEFCKTSPLACDTKNYAFSRPSIETTIQEIQNDKHNKASATDSNFEKNVFVQTNEQHCFYLLHNMDMDKKLKKKSNSFWEEKYPKKEQATKGTNMKSLYQDNILNRDTLNNFDFVANVSKNKSFSFTTIKQKMDKNFDFKANRIRQRNKDSNVTPFVKKKQISSKTKNTIFSRQAQSRKNGNLFPPIIDKPYLIHDLSNKCRHDSSLINIFNEKPVKCKTSSSSFSSMIGATTTTTTDSSHSFPREKYKNYRQSNANGANTGYYKNSFYALHINVTRRNERKYKLEPYECEPGACFPAPGQCDPIECDKLIKNRLKRKTSKTSTDDGSRTVSSGSGSIKQGIASIKQNVASPKRHSNVSAKTAKQGLQYRTFPPRRSRRGARQAVRISSSFSFNIEFSKNTAPVYVKNAGREQHPGKKHPKSESTGEKKYSNACMKTCPKCRNIGTICPCPTLQHTESQSEPELQNVGINTHSNKCVCTLKLHKSGRLYRDRAVKAKKMHIKPKVFKETGHKAMTGYKPDYDTITVADKSINRQLMLDVECEPGTCIPGECDPYACLEIIKKRGMGTKGDGPPMLSTKKAISTKAHTEKAGKRTQLKENKNDESSKQVTRIGSNFSFNVEFYKNRTVSDKTRKQLARAKNMFTEENKDAKDSVGSPVTAPSKPRNKKNIYIGVDRDNIDNGIQNTKELRHQDSQVNTPAQDKTTKTGEFFERCFCTAKLHGIKVPSKLLITQPHKKKKICVLI